MREVAFFEVGDSVNAVVGEKGKIGYDRLTTFGLKSWGKKLEGGIKKGIFE